MHACILTHLHIHTHKTQVLLIFIIVSLMVLAYAAELNQTSTYEDTVEAMCGPIAKFFSVLCLVAFCFGATTAFLTVVGDQIVDSKCLYYYAVVNNSYYDSSVMHYHMCTVVT